MGGKELRLVIAVPSTSTWCAEFGMSLLFLASHLTHQVPGFRAQQFRVHNKRGSILASMRQQLVEQALQHNASHLLFIDSDQTFPRDLVHRLLAHEKQVVGCNVATKCLPANPTARLRDGLHGTPLYTTFESTGLVEVWRLGTGIMMLDLNLFKREGMKQGPWFDQRWDEELQHYVGEDWGFCERLEASGVKIWVDQDLSKEIGHLGMLEYHHGFVEVPRAEEARTEIKEAV